MNSSISVEAYSNGFASKRLKTHKDKKYATQLKTQTRIKNMTYLKIFLVAGSVLDVA